MVCRNGADSALGGEHRLKRNADVPVPLTRSQLSGNDDPAPRLTSFLITAHENFLLALYLINKTSILGLNFVLYRSEKEKKRKRKTSKILFIVHMKSETSSQITHSLGSAQSPNAVS